jgi:TATA-box binding protein (TBP) (component of TFIID and TFIIIB)
MIFENCKGAVDENTGIQYTDLSISTMTVCFKFSNIIHLHILKENLKDKLKINYNPGSKKSKVPKKKGTDSFYNSFDIKLVILDNFNNVFSNASVFIFPNGNVKVAGVKTIHTINVLITELIEIFKSVENCVDNINELKAENIKIQMICSDFKIKPLKKDPDGWCLKQDDLKNILVQEYSLSATFSALSRYPGINLKCDSLIGNKPISLLIFRSGSIIITGAKDIRDIVHCYSFIISIIKKHKDKLFYYDINEEIKQKKKKKQINFPVSAPSSL